jgi:helix-turn-helix protein
MALRDELSEIHIRWLVAALTASDPDVLARKLLVGAAEFAAILGGMVGSNLVDVGEDGRRVELTKTGRQLADDLAAGRP